ncbi:hypothetical protein [Flavobacterium sp.]
MKNPQFEINLSEIINSEILKTSVQKVILLEILSNYKKAKYKRFFTLSDKLAETANVTLMTFRKERKVLEELELFYVKIKEENRFITAKIIDRKHKKLFYFPNFKKLAELSFISIKENNIKTEFEVEHIFSYDDYEKIKDELIYHFRIINANRSTTSQDKMYGKDLKRTLKVINNNYVNHHEIVDYHFKLIEIITPKKL